MTSIRPAMRLAFLVLGATILSITVGARGHGTAQAPPPPAAPPVPSARSIAPVDFTGYWTAVVTEDWRYRMIAPARGDYASVPLNAEGRKVADAWDPANDEA